MNNGNKKRIVLGCDIGNGYGYVSVLLDKDRDPVVLLPGKYGLTGIGMPTAACVLPPDGKEIAVFQNGKPAEVRYRNRPEQMVRAIKTRLKENTIPVKGIESPVSTDAVYGEIAKSLILLAEEELKNLNSEPVYDVVFTFPAAFADQSALLERMQNSISRITLDGRPIRVLGRLPEPAAVAIDYLHYMQHIAPEEIRITEKKFTVLVYDLGHGTFDTAVVTAQSEGVPYILHSKAGLAQIGGKNFDEVLYEELLNGLEEQYGYKPQNERQREIIREEAVKAKIALSSTDAVEVSVLNDEEYCRVEITRDRFEKITRHLLFQTFELVEKVLEESSRAGIRIDGIVLSGGASQMPMVIHGLKELMEDEYPVVLYRPGEAVSFGAARFAAEIPEEKPVAEKKPEKKTTPRHPADEPAQLLKNRILDQLTDCAYGIWFPSEEKLEGEVEFLIQSGQPRPAVSERIECYAASSRLTIKIYRSRKNSRMIQRAAVDECESVLWVTFDVTPDTKYEVSIKALENYGIEAELRSETGEVFRKSTSDDFFRLG